MTTKEYKDKLNEKLNSNFEIDVRETLMQAVEYFKAETILFLLYSIFLISLNLLTLQIQPIGSVINVIVMPILISGFFYAAHQIDKGEKLTINDFFRGFNSWMNILIASILSGVLVALGLFLLVIPGIYLAVAYTFAIPFIVYADFEYWEAMEASRQLITKNFWNIMGLILVLLMINFLGLMLFGIGIFFTLPLTYLSIHTAFHNIFPNTDTKANRDPQQIDLRHFR